MLNEVRGNFDSFLEARPSGKPFCYWWGPTNTHRPWEKGSGEAIWGLDPDDLKGRMPDFLPDVPEVREDFCDYLGECMAFDAGLGVIIQRLEEIGELDNTLIVVSGDHGMPGVPRAKCNLYDLGTQVALAARWPKHIKPGRIVNDFVNLMDLAPTFLEAAHVAIPEGAAAKSLIPIMESKKSGQIEPERNFVITGRERHVRVAREGNLPYPMRAIRTPDHLYIINFAPERWPLGTPFNYSDMDRSPTLTWMIDHRNDENVRQSFELGFGKRPAEELYDLRKDPDYMTNQAENLEYAAIKIELRERLITELRNQKDPRVLESPCRFDLPPYAGQYPGLQFQSCSI